MIIEVYKRNNKKNHEPVALVYSFDVKHAKGDMPTYM